MLSDLEIAERAELVPISEIAGQIGLLDDEIETYGRYKAKVSLAAIERRKGGRLGKLILVSGTSPTSAGEGKTTVSVGLGQALAKIGKEAAICLREPSLGPCMGLKGGAAGGGFSQVVPMEDINLHFTGDFHAITAAHNLLAAMLDNHLHQGNALGIDTRQITWPRALDMNDRALRQIVIGLGGRSDGVPRESGFVITVASEVMAILCLATGIADLRRRLGDIVVGYRADGSAVTCRDLNAHGAMAALLKDAIKPNLVQTLEHTPAFIHGGPFANIAHGTNSILATRLALETRDYAVVETGFGSELGAEKFMDIVAPASGLWPAAAVLVTTVRALKMQGGVPAAELKREDLDRLALGLVNLDRHIDNLLAFGLPPVVAVNIFPTDSLAERELVLAHARSRGVPAEEVDAFQNGGDGTVRLAERVVEAAEQVVEPHSLYAREASLVEKIETVARTVYGADGVEFAPAASRRLGQITAMGLGHLPVCLAKNQYSFTDDPSRLGRPTGFTVTVKEVRLNAGAGFVVVLLGSVMQMPGLPKQPAAERMDLTEDGRISGLF